ncbi:hypothetical protein MCOR30_006927 [Pyricularia oryzae]|nr:hypothetical protein MCOR30_006927 [Pyricularia oryzae]KAI6568121.1 hypothetical protein MCOR09_005887 [Pyricularia oryzae]
MSTSKLGLKEYIEMCAGKWNAIIVEEVGWGSLGGESSMIEFLVAFLNCPVLLTKDKDKPYVNMGKTFVFIITSSVVDTIESHFRNWANCPPTGLPLDEGHDPLSPPDLDSWGFLENPENGRKEVKLMGEMRKVLTESLGKSVGQSSIQAAECAGSLLGILPGKPLYRGLCCIDVNVRQG